MTPRSFLAAAPVLSLAAPALLLLGCASSQATRLGADGFRIECTEKMSSCANRADTLCGDRGYTVVGGGTRSSMLGGKTGYQAKSRATELIVRCGEPTEDELAAQDALASRPAAKPARVDGEAAPPAAVPAPPTPAASAPVAPPARPVAACVPGSTQKCIGPGACEGGQACSSDGSGFGACDCGQPAASAPAGY